MTDFKNILSLFGLVIFMILPGALIFGAPEELTLDDAVSNALASDPGVQSAKYDLLAAQAKADAASWKMLPSLTLSAGYKKLSEMEPAEFMGTTLPKGLTDNYMLSANLEYPVFAGFRIREAIEIARLTSTGKQLAGDLVSRAIVFETRRAYWEAVRAGRNVEMLEKNLELNEKNAEIVRQRLKQGAATNTQVMNANMQVSRARLDLEDAKDRRTGALMNLAVLNGADIQNIDSESVNQLYILDTTPDSPLLKELQGMVDESALVMKALGQRPETKLSDLKIETARHMKQLSEAGLYPTLAISGNYLFADPNPRVYFQTDPALFTGTWSLGIQLSYDLGGILPNLSESKAAEQMINKAKSDGQKQRSKVIVDVRTCLMTFNRIRDGLALSREMVGQAEENLRIVNQQYTAGTVTSFNVLSAELALLRAQFDVTNKEIDLQIAAADLSRAAALESF